MAAPPRAVAPQASAPLLTIRIRLWDGSQIHGAWVSVAQAAVDYPYPLAIAWEVVPPKGAFW